MTDNRKEPSKEQIADLLSKVRMRFEKNMGRHEGLDWNDVEKRIESRPERLRSLFEMEETGGEPDVIGFDTDTSEYIFADCAAESPAGRRSLCYDDVSLKSRKTNRPEGSAVSVGASMGIDILTEEQYRDLQKIGEFDLRTSSWIATPEDIRSAGGALFCDRRYGHVFTYHNGAGSYYASRGFRGLLRI